jgi:hypothetical protein
MKKMILLFSLMGSVTFAQETENFAGEITLGQTSKSFFVKEGQNYRFKDYEKVFSNPDAVYYIKRAQTNKTFADILGFVGGFGLGYGIGTAISGKNDDPHVKSKRSDGWVIAGVGLGVIGTAIPLYIGFKKNVKKGMAVENGEVSKNTVSTQLNFIIDNNGAGLSLTF